MERQRQCTWRLASGSLHVLVEPMRELEWMDGLHVEWIKVWASRTQLVAISLRTICRPIRDWGLNLSECGLATAACDGMAVRWSQESRPCPQNHVNLPMCCREMCARWIHCAQAYGAGRTVSAVDTHLLAWPLAPCKRSCRLLHAIKASQV